jgi:hypothetical protein
MTERMVTSEHVFILDSVRRLGLTWLPAMVGRCHSISRLEGQRQP